MGEEQRPHSARENRGLVDSIAREIIREERIVLTSDRDRYTKILTRTHVLLPGPDTAAYVGHLRQLIWNKVRNKVCRMSAETMGRIASTGSYDNLSAQSTSLYQVHNCQPWLEEQDSGDHLLILIATTTVIARMWDILNEEFRAKQAKAAAPAETPASK
ncbi:MAG: hypothetical protein Q7N87_01910 [Candidatus Uhrbacteria bacterium]|nr:hypothetical protein [Candidatus Uhrbacteria bacterium]